MSTTSQSSVATSSSTPSSTSSPNSNASTLLFGFLVSALSIFAVFMTCAIVWNRLIVRRHAIDATLVMTPPLQSPRFRRPKTWSAWVMPNNQSLSWLDLKPVAACKSSCPPGSSWTMPTEQTTSSWRSYVWNHIPPEITYLFHRPTIPPMATAPSDTNISHIELSDGSDIQVSLLIAMPHAPQSTRAGACEAYELAFATTNIRYHDLTSS